MIVILPNYENSRDESTRGVVHDGSLGTVHDKGRREPESREQNERDPDEVHANHNFADLACSVSPSWVFDVLVKCDSCQNQPAKQLKY